MAKEIICLGRIFKSIDERRKYFRNELRKILPELKKIDGFPIGEDEDIIALSDPPYYTACPNPWLNDFIVEWENEKDILVQKGTRNLEFNVNEPYASDVSEGKNNPVYYAHSYHTKVPHPAIMRYILHYTQPGDIVFDGFAGTGMTGVAASKCENPDPETKYKIEKEWESMFQNRVQWGLRKNITSDLSPIASFIAYNYNKYEVNELVFNFFKSTLQSFDNEFGWMYETIHTNGQKAKINYIIWSEVFLCTNCNGEIVFWDDAIDVEVGKVKENFNCPHCGKLTNKNEIERFLVSKFDTIIGKSINQPQYNPVLIDYSINNKRYQKKPDSNDFIVLSTIEKLDIKDFAYPTNSLPSGDKTNEALRVGYTNTHHFYTKRNLIALSFFWEKSITLPIQRLFITSILVKTASILHNIGLKDGKINLAGALPNAIYISSLIAERNIPILLNGKFEDFLKINFESLKNSPTQVSSSTCLKNIKSNTIDYIFVDPPFGSNLMYSELNFIHESWLKVLTNNRLEAIENRTQNKSTLEYQNILTDCFSEYYRILKTGKWMTVEFSNTNAAVWNSLQVSLQRAGFVIANVSALDKQQGTFNAQTTPTAVKQDLVLSCYKPTKENENIQDHEIDKGIWNFISTHLKHLPVHLKKDNNTTLVIERSPKVLYDRLISYLIIKGLLIPIDAKEFHLGLKQKFHERDGMYFTQEQVHEYDEKKAKAPTMIQASWQIATESEGIEWLKRELKDNKLKYQDIQPKWMQAITALRKGDILPELRDILQQNFIEQSDGSWRVPDMNEARDREIIRNKALLKEFNGYVVLANNPKSKRMKEVRVESLRAGFRNCWDTKDFHTIVKISDKIPQNLLLEDEQLLMFYDIAKDRV